MTETTYNNDISRLANINELYESSVIKKWIKLYLSICKSSYKHQLPIS